jgi:hypothetical protein
MPISEPEWASIRKMVETIAGQYSGRRDAHFSLGEVIKRDEDRKLVWLAEFGDQAIPLVYFDQEVKYYDENHLGVVKVRKAPILMKVPQIGDTVLVAKEFGTRRLPRCLGVLQGFGFIDQGED